MSDEPKVYLLPCNRCGRYFERPASWAGKVPIRCPECRRAVVAEKAAACFQALKKNKRAYKARQAKIAAYKRARRAQLREARSKWGDDTLLGKTPEQ